MYEGEIIHLKGGMVEYFGMMDQLEHPNGPGWYRIVEPCIYFQTVDENGGIAYQLVRIWGRSKLYKKYVDIYCPADSLQEIRVLDPKGDFYDAYQEELKRPDLNLIISPKRLDVR